MDGSLFIGISKIETTMEQLNNITVGLRLPRTLYDRLQKLAMAESLARGRHTYWSEIVRDTLAEHFPELKSKHNKRAKGA